MGVFAVFGNDIVDGDVEQTHIGEEFMQRVLHEVGATLLHDAVAGSCRDVVAHATTLVDDAIARQLLVCLHRRVGVDLKEGTIVADARDAHVVAKAACKYLVADAVRDLQVDGTVL